jgi:hypothetical protein
MIKRLIRQSRFFQKPLLPSFFAKLFAQLSDRLQEHMSQEDESIDSPIFSMSLVARMYLKYITDSPEELHIFAVRLFLLQPFVRSRVYVAFKRSIARNPNTIRLQAIFAQFISLVQVHPRLAGDVLSRVLKAMPDFPADFEEESWSLAEDWLGHEEAFYPAVVIISRFVARPSCNPSFFPAAVAIVPRLIRDSDCHMVIKGLRIALSLLTHDAIPMGIYQSLLAHLVVRSNFFEGPYSALTIRLLKVKPELLSQCNQELIEAIYFFAIDIFRTVGSLPRLVILFQRAPHLATLLPFSIIRSITRSLVHRRECSDTSAKGNKLENICLCGLKLCISVHPSQEELTDFCQMVFTYLCDVLNDDLLKSRDLFENICAHMVKADPPSFPLVPFRRMAERNRMEKADFLIVSFAAKLLPPATLLSYQPFIIHAIEEMITFAPSAQTHITIFTVGLVKHASV